MKPSLKDPRTLEALISQYGGKTPKERKRATFWQRVFSILSADEWADDVTEELRDWTDEKGKVKKARVLAGLTTLPLAARYGQDAVKHLAGGVTGNPDWVDAEGARGRDLPREWGGLWVTKLENQKRKKAGLEPMDKLTSKEWDIAKDYMYGTEDKTSTKAKKKWADVTTGATGFGMDVFTPSLFASYGGTGGAKALKKVAGLTFKEGLEKAGVEGVEQLTKKAAEKLAKKSLKSAGINATKARIKSLAKGAGALDDIAKSAAKPGLYSTIPFATHKSKLLKEGKNWDKLGHAIENPIFAAGAGGVGLARKTKFGAARVDDVIDITKKLAKPFNPRAIFGGAKEPQDWLRTSESNLAGAAQKQVRVTEETAEGLKAMVEAGLIKDNSGGRDVLEAAYNFPGATSHKNLVNNLVDLGFVDKKNKRKVLKIFHESAKVDKGKGIVDDLVGGTKPPPPTPSPTKYSGPSSLEELGPPPPGGADEYYDTTYQNLLLREWQDSQIMDDIVGGSPKAPPSIDDAAFQADRLSEWQGSQIMDDFTPKRSLSSSYIQPSKGENLKIAGLNAKLDSLLKGRTMAGGEGRGIPAMVEAISNDKSRTREGLEELKGIYDRVLESKGKEYAEGIVGMPMRYYEKDLKAQRVVAASSDILDDLTKIEKKRVLPKGSFAEIEKKFPVDPVIEKGDSAVARELNESDLLAKEVEKFYASTGEGGVFMPGQEGGKLMSEGWAGKSNANWGDVVKDAKDWYRGTLSKMESSFDIKPRLEEAGKTSKYLSARDKLMAISKAVKGDEKRLAEVESLLTKTDAGPLSKEAQRYIDTMYTESGAEELIKRSFDVDPGEHTLKKLPKDFDFEAAFKKKLGEPGFNKNLNDELAKRHAREMGISQEEAVVDIAKKRAMYKKSGRYTLPMNYMYGGQGLPGTADTAFQESMSGRRTSSLRKIGSTPKNVKEGSIIDIGNTLTGEKQVVEITGRKEVHFSQADELSPTERWTPDFIRKYMKKQGEKGKMEQLTWQIITEEEAAQKTAVRKAGLYDVEDVGEGLAKAKIRPEARPILGGATIDSPVIGDIWDQKGIPVVTTNMGGVHGRGLAKQAKDLGFITNKNFNVATSPDGVITLAVKGNAPETALKKGAAYSEKVTGGNLDLLSSEIDELIKIARKNPDQTYFMPYAGMGFGEGSAEEIFPILKKIEEVDNIRFIARDDTVAGKYAGSFAKGIRGDTSKMAEDLVKPSDSKKLKDKIALIEGASQGIEGVGNPVYEEAIKGVKGKVAIVGSRGFTDQEAVFEVLDDLAARGKMNGGLVSGGAKGPDSFAANWHKEVVEGGDGGLTPFKEILPDWSKGKGAALARNSKIVEESDYVVAFWDGVSKGTKDTIDKARAAGKKVVVITPEDITKSPDQLDIFGKAADPGLPLKAGKVDEFGNALPKKGSVEDLIGGGADLPADAMESASKGFEPWLQDEEKLLNINPKVLERALSDSGIDPKEAEDLLASVKGFQGDTIRQQEVLADFKGAIDGWAIPDSDKANIKSAFDKLGDYYESKAWEDPLFRKQGISDLKNIERTLDKAVELDPMLKKQVEAIKQVVIKPARFQIEDIKSKVGPAFTRPDYVNFPKGDNIESKMLAGGHKSIFSKPMMEALNEVTDTPLELADSLEAHAKAQFGFAAGQEAKRGATEESFRGLIKIVKDKLGGDELRIVKKGRPPEGFTKLGKDLSGDESLNKLLEDANIFVAKGSKNEVESVFKHYNPKETNELLGVVKSSHNLWKIMQTGGGVDFPKIPDKYLGEMATDGNFKKGLKIIGEYYNDNGAFGLISQAFTTRNAINNYAMIVVGADMSPGEAFLQYAKGIRSVEFMRRAAGKDPNLGVLSAGAKVFKKGDEDFTKLIEDVEKSGMVQEMFHASENYGGGAAETASKMKAGKAMGRVVDWAAGGRAVSHNNAVELASKIAIFDKKRQMGWSIPQAKKAADRILFDYSDVTAFERDVVKPWTVFYTWTKKNVELMYYLAKEEPNRFKVYGKSLGATRNFEGDLDEEERAAMPEWLNKYVTVRSKDDEGNLSAVTGLGTNIEAAGDFLGDDPKDALLSAMGMTAPVPRMIGELAFDHSAFKDAPISEDTSAYKYRSMPQGFKDALGIREQTYTNNEGEESTTYKMDGKTKYLLENIIGRPIGNIAKQASILKGDQPAGRGILAQSTGLRYNTYDTDYLMYKQNKKEYEEAMEILKRMGIMKQRNYYYYDKGAEQRYPGSSQYFQ